MTDPWWRGAAIYQVYIRSFADSGGDGVGDIAGMRARLGYLRDLGVDAVWINPWYVSPMVDGGYDVADYRDIDPVFGTLADAEDYIREAHGHRLRVIVDMVPNHCSSSHPWFRAALAAGPGSAERARFIFRPGKGTNGELPPNDWVSGFGGPAWTRVSEVDSRPGDWYLHLFAADQPDFNWENPEVRAEFHDILRFWLDRDVDGFRIDAADTLVKDPALPDMAAVPAGAPSPQRGQAASHEIFRGWHRVLAAYPGDRVLIGEIWLNLPDRAAYHAPDELHTSFSFDLIRHPWSAPGMRQVIDATLESATATGAPPTWLLGNHDVTRVVTRYGRDDTRLVPAVRAADIPTDHALGTRRARAAALLTLALPGSVCIYQGDELGLWEVEDIPAGQLRDPVWEASGHTDRGRDGCRVPMPWFGDAAPFGFSPDGAAEPWLPQPAAWRDLTVAAQEPDPASTLRLYRDALRIRAEAALGEGPMTWLETERGALAFSRPGGLACAVNLSDHPGKLTALARHHEVLLASAPLEGSPDDGRLLPPDTAVWLRTV